MKIRAAISLVLVFALVIISLRAPVLACGPFFEEPNFVGLNHPDSESAYNGGKLGVLQPGFYRAHLIVAYRHLTGIGMPVRQPVPPAASTNWVLAWKMARQQVSGKPPRDLYEFPPLSREVKLSDGGFYTYPNCMEDAFRTAVATLNARKMQYGADSPELKDWAAAQDQVFGNCQNRAGAAMIPAAAPAGASPLARADRAYQIAAANFYSEKWDDGRQQFAAIAQDRSSPWRATAALLVARTLIRQATVPTPPEKPDTQRLAEAASQLRTVLADPSLQPVHASATRLLAYLRLRLEPAARLAELSASLRGASTTAVQFDQDLTDYTAMLDKVVDGDGSLGLPKLEDLQSRDELADWIFTFQRRDLAHALAEWNKAHSRAWLVAALSTVDAKDQAAGELIKAAAAVKPDAPEYEMAAYQRVRLLLQSGQDDDARKLAAATLKLPGAARSTANLLRGVLLRLAPSFGDLLAAAPRVPGSSDVHKRLFDADAAQLFNEAMPLPMLMDAARTNALPENLRREIAVSAWTRAVLFNNEGAARELAPVLATLAPDIRPAMEEYRGADASSRRFIAALTMLRFPGLRIAVPVGEDRATPIGKIDNLRDNWWPGNPYAPPQQGLPEYLAPLYPGGKLDSPSWLSAEQKAEAAKEAESVRNAPPAAAWAGPIVLEWARLHADDRRVPEALHLVVRAGHFGSISNADSSRVSKQCFELLHRRYPNSSWAKQTRYWYN